MHGAVLSEFPVSQKVWSFVKSPDASLTEFLSAQTGISKVLAGLLADQRGHCFDHGLALT
jgi:hypothetical protein